MAVYVALGMELLLWCTVLALIRLGFPFGALAALLLVVCVNGLALVSGLRWGAGGGGLLVRWPGWRRFLLWLTPAGIYCFPAWVCPDAHANPDEAPLLEWQRKIALGIGSAVVSIGCLLAAFLLNVPPPVRAGAAPLPVERLTSCCSAAVRPGALLGTFDERPGPAPGCVCAATAFLQRMKADRPDKIELALILIEESVRSRQPIPDQQVAGLWALSLRACRAR
jgi:hypothetical protein